MRANNCRAYSQLLPESVESGEKEKQMPRCCAVQGAFFASADGSIETCHGRLTSQGGSSTTSAQVDAGVVECSMTCPGS